MLLTDTLEKCDSERKRWGTAPSIAHTLEHCSRKSISHSFATRKKGTLSIPVIHFGGSGFITLKIFSGLYRN